MVWKMQLGQKSTKWQNSFYCVLHGKWGFRKPEGSFSGLPYCKSQKITQVLNKCWKWTTYMKVMPLERLMHESALDMVDLATKLCLGLSEVAKVVHNGFGDAPRSWQGIAYSSLLIYIPGFALMLSKLPIIAGYKGLAHAYLVSPMQILIHDPQVYLYNNSKYNYHLCFFESWIFWLWSNVVEVRLISISMVLLLFQWCACFVLPYVPWQKLLMKYL